MEINCATSDEMAPIDVPRRLVYAYPHALCLKSPPPAPYRLPAGTIDTGSRLHVPVETVPATTPQTLLELGALVFLRREPGKPSGCSSISAADAAVRLMENALNALAHPASGIDAAINLAKSVPCYLLETSDLKFACSAIRSILIGSTLVADPGQSVREA